MKVGGIVKNYCVNCSNKTNHRVIAVDAIMPEYHEYDISFYFSIVKCLGCAESSFRKESHDAENMYQDENGEYTPEISVDIYPPVLYKHRRLENSYMLPLTIASVYDESINALKAGCKILSGAGFRAIIEAVCIDKGVSGRDLESKINNLVKKGFITKNESDRLHSIRFIGNDSIHEMKVPQQEQLELVLSIVEHLLNNLYLIDAQAKVKLERVISDYHDFEELLNKRIGSFSIGEELTLYKLFGKEFRRIKENKAAFEKKLISNISSGLFKSLGLGSVKPDASNPKVFVQYFIVN